MKKTTITPLIKKNKAYNDVGGRNSNSLVFTPPVNTNAYDYFVFWRAKTKYHYIPGKEKKGKFYLLIGPDPDNQWSYNGWLQTVIKTGKVIKSVKLPSGFNIQERAE